jgi:hypothetical protein
MGQRANLVIVENQRYQLFYNHWCANSLDNNLFWGVEHSLAFIKLQQEVSESGWLDEVWAEGGVVVDLDCKVLLFFGGEDILWNVPLRRFYLQLLKQVWTGWTVEWADRGIVDIAEYVSYPRDRVLSKTEDDYSLDLNPPEQKDWIDLVGSFEFDDGEIYLFPLSYDVTYYLTAGTQLINYCQQENGLKTLHLQDWTENFPLGGFHVNISAKTLNFWSADDMPNLENRTVNWHRDRYESQLELTKGYLQFPTYSRDFLEQKIIQILLNETKIGSLDNLLSFIEREKEKGSRFEISPWALKDAQLDLSINERRQILMSALAATKNY